MTKININPPTPTDFAEVNVDAMGVVLTVPILVMTGHGRFAENTLDPEVAEALAVELSEAAQQVRAMQAAQVNLPPGAKGA